MLPVLAQHGSIKVVNPFTAPEDQAAGAKLFRAQCASCHGSNGRGTTAGPDLTSGTLRRGSSDEAVFQTISKGSPGTAMPAFNFNGERIWQLVTHLRGLSIARGATQAKGNPAEGKRIYQSSGCSGCHVVAGEGGLMGPDLTGVGLRLSLAELRSSVLQPDGSVSPEYWSASLRMTSGQKITGTRLNEDTYSIQLRDSRGKLISVLRNDVAQYEIVRKSPMPGTSAKLKEPELEHLFAYLANLRSSENESAR